MRKVGSWMLPGSETHMLSHISSNDSYQLPHRRAAIKACKEYRLAVDIGAHVGLWTRDLAFHFKKVIAFEPVPEFRKLLQINTTMCKNIEIQPFALGNKKGTVSMTVDPYNTGHTHVRTTLEKMSNVVAQLTTLDEFELKGVNFIKIDCEGYEMNVLEGAKETLLRCKPIVVIEQKTFLPYGGEQFDGVKYLQSLGAKQVNRVVDDHIMGW